MIKFNSFDEISAAFPIDGKSNQSFSVYKDYCFVLAAFDFEEVKRAHPDGWLDKIDHRWYFFDINQKTWYDTYIYDGKNWILGKDTWDGIVFAEQPEWGIHHMKTLHRYEFGLFKTEEEAIEYRNKKLKERLEF